MEERRVNRGYEGLACIELFALFCFVATFLVGFGLRGCVGGFEHLYICMTFAFME